MMNGCAYTLEDAMRVRTGRVSHASAEGGVDAKALSVDSRYQEPQPSSSPRRPRLLKLKCN